MKQAFKALWLLVGVYSILAFSAVDLYAQETFPIEGTWKLDSVQVKEIVQDNVMQKTVLPSEECNFNHTWMLQFTLNPNGKASYTGENNHTISDVPYFVEDITGNRATLIIDGVPEYKILKMQLTSTNAMLISISFITGYDMKDMEVGWEMYYRKSE